MSDDTDCGGGIGTCPHCGVDPASEVCGRLGWCLLTPAQRARLAPAGDEGDDDDAE